jgi:hypothetical protein
LSRSVVSRSAPCGKARLQTKLERLPERGNEACVHFHELLAGPGSVQLIGGIVQGEGEGGESHGRAAWRSEADKSIARCSASPRKIHVRRCAALGAALRPVSISEGHSVFTNWLRMIAVVLLVVGIPAAEAAPLVPSSDLPGRERYRFTPSPLDRFMQPNPPARPLLQWDCGPRGGWWGKARSRRTRPC